MNIKVMFEKYLNYCSLYRRKGTYNAYKKSFVLLNKVFDNFSIEFCSKINQDVYDKIIQYLKINTNKKNSKINSLMSDFKAVINFNKIILDCTFFKLEDDTVHYKALNDFELVTLLKTLKKYPLDNYFNLLNVTAITIMLDTGTRKSETLNIVNKNIDFYLNTISLDVTKTSKRTVLFGQLSEYFIKKLFNKNNVYLLHNESTNNQMKRNTLEKFFLSLNKKLRFNSGNVTPHRLRKTFATQLLKKGCPLTTIRLLLGHKDIKTTMIYLDIDSLMIEKDYTQFYPY